MSLTEGVVMEQVLAMATSFTMTTGAMQVAPMRQANLSPMKDHDAIVCVSSKDGHARIVCEEMELCFRGSIRVQPCSPVGHGIFVPRIV